MLPGKRCLKIPELNKISDKLIGLVHTTENLIVGLQLQQ